MKKIVIAMCVAAASLGAVSCSNSFLEQTPETGLTSDTFYKTVSHMQQALIACYPGVRTVAQEGIFMDEMRSDNAFYTRYSPDRGAYLGTETLALFLETGASNSWDHIWNHYREVYRYVCRTNVLIDRIESSDLSEDETNGIKAEALFLRAFYYFDLVQHWGRVPLVLHLFGNVNDAFVAKATLDELYGQMLSDINEAISLGLPIATTFPQNGHATMGAAKMLRAYINMSKPSPDYPTAEKDLIDITKMNYKLLDDYSSIFLKTNKNNQESIFEAQFTEDGSTDQYSTFPWNLIPRCSNNEVLMGIAGGNYTGGGGGWCVPTQEMIDSYEKGDLRLDASISVAEGHINQSEQFTFTEMKSVIGYVKPADKDFHYMVKKYYHPPYAYSMRADDNFPVYRYSGALLLLSECLVKENKSSEALPYINQVRARAGLQPLESVTIENVMDEMRHELAFENHRWQDLVRNDMAIPVMTEFGKTMKSLYGWILPEAFNVTEARLVYPIPQHEYDFNKLLTDE